MPFETTPSPKTIQKPVSVLSVSRATDIPAFYMEWFLNRLKAGYCHWRNPFSGVLTRVSFEQVRAIVFWSKNPKPLLERLDELERYCKQYYIQFTLNDYEAEHLEPAVPSLQERIATFQALSQRLGKARVMWRFDPLVLTRAISVETLLEKVARVGKAIAPFTTRLIFSFVDIQAYRSVQANLTRADIGAREFSGQEMHTFLRGLQQLNKAWGLELCTCSEVADLSAYGVTHGSCVDALRLAQLFGAQDPTLLDTLGYEMDLFGNLSPKTRTKGRRRDSGQRDACGCAPSKDIGTYGTCPHMCLYCYANHRPTLVHQAHQAILSDPTRESLQ